MRDLYTPTGVTMTAGELSVDSDVPTTTQVTLRIDDTESRYWIQARIILDGNTYHALRSLGVPHRIVLARNGTPMDGYYSLKAGQIRSLAQGNATVLQLMLEARAPVTAGA